MVNYRYITQFSAVGTSIILLSSSMSVNGQKGTTTAVKLLILLVNTSLHACMHHAKTNYIAV